ncbi:hypothetical protein ACIQU2_08030 [Pseudomonas sp. NPDC098740]|uniref:hypothetical protein n=1 Tax=Pseudomonas sp. NPDC098740 TaxID=3364486 RepID=UPI00383AB843
MTANMRVTSTIEGSFTAKIQGHKDFKADRLQIYKDTEDMYHFSGMEEGSAPTNPFRTIYIITEKDAVSGQHTFPKGIKSFIYVHTTSSGATDKEFIKEGTCTIDFDPVNQRYKMSFLVKVQFPDAELRDIMGSFDLTQN